MEDRSGYKISLLSMILLILNFVLIVVVIVMGLTIYSLKKNNKTNENVIENTTDMNVNINENNIVEEDLQNTVTENKESKRTSNNSKEETNNKNNTNDSVGKIVDNMAYIYNAQYTAENISVKQYSTNDGTSYSISDIILPYININSSDAKKANNEIQENYKKYIEEFRICSQNKNSYIKSEYKTYVTSNIISVLIMVNRGQEEKNEEEYIAYNFDTISGIKLEYDNVYQIAGINDIKENVLNSIKSLDEYEEYYLKAGRNITQEMVDERNSEIELSKTQTFTYYQEDLMNNRLVYFLDNNLKLNIVIRLSLPNDDEIYNKIITVES